IGIGKRKDIDLDLPGQVGDETGAAAVARKPRILGNGLARAGLHLWDRRPGPKAQNRKESSPGGDRPRQRTHRSHLPSPAPPDRGPALKRTPGTEPGPPRFEPEIPYGY